MASLTMALPRISTASQDISNLPSGRAMMSPGTKSLEDNIRVSYFNDFFIIEQKNINE